MSKEACFIINNNTLFLDHVLVSFNDTPIFFICYDNRDCYYLVLCTDMDALEYIIVAISLRTIYRLLTQKTEMRAPFIAADCFWKVNTGSSVYEDVIQYLDGKHLDLEMLPYPNALYEAINEADKAYVEKIKDAYFSEAEYVSFKASTENIATEDYVDFTSISIHPMTQYIEFDSAINWPFSRSEKSFECHWSGKTDLIFYAEQMVQHIETVPSNKLMEEIFSGKISSLPDAA